MWGARTCHNFLRTFRKSRLSTDHPTAVQTYLKINLSLDRAVVFALGFVQFNSDPLARGETGWAVESDYTLHFLADHFDPLADLKRRHLPRSLLKMFRAIARFDVSILRLRSLTAAQFAVRCTYSSAVQM